MGGRSEPRNFVSWAEEFGKNFSAENCGP